MSVSPQPLSQESCPGQRKRPEEGQPCSWLLFSEQWAVLSPSSRAPPLVLLFPFLSSPVISYRLSLSVPTSALPVGTSHLSPLTLSSVSSVSSCADPPCSRCGDSLEKTDAEKSVRSPRHGQRPQRQGQHGQSVPLQQVWQPCLMLSMARRSPCLWVCALFWVRQCPLDSGWLWWKSPCPPSGCALVSPAPCGWLA